MGLTGERKKHFKMLSEMDRKRSEQDYENVSKCSVAQA